eukprot:1378776-Amorphochlora_amoeboformis.AAC.1
MKTKSVPGKRKHVKTRKHKMSAPEGSDDEKHEGLKEQVRETDAFREREKMGSCHRGPNGQKGLHLSLSEFR